MHAKKQRLPEGANVVILHIEMGPRGVEDFVAKFLEDHPGTDRTMALEELDKHRIDGDSFLPSLLPFLVNGGVSVNSVSRTFSPAVADITVTVK